MKLVAKKALFHFKGLSRTKVACTPINKNSNVLIGDKNLFWSFVDLKNQNEPLF